jgi:hypothetical protein
MNYEETEALRKINQEHAKAYKIALAEARKTPNTEVQSAFSEKVGAAMPADFSTRARLHYAKAVRKHPRFADALFGNNVLGDAEDRLTRIRDQVVYFGRCCWLDGTTLEKCEIAEANVAYLQGDAAACVEELYDAVAVLMRMIAVVEGKQKLGGEK